jgi:hypothetical protein
MSRREIITGEVTLQEIHQRLVAAYGLELAYVEFEAAWLQPYSTPMPGMAELVRGLSNDHGLVLLSNVDRYYWNVVRRARTPPGPYAADHERHVADGSPSRSTLTPRDHSLARHSSSAVRRPRVFRPAGYTTRTFRDLDRAAVPGRLDDAAANRASHPRRTLRRARRTTRGRRRCGRMGRVERQWRWTCPMSRS